MKPLIIIPILFSVLILIESCQTKKPSDNVDNTDSTKESKDVRFDFTATWAKGQDTIYGAIKVDAFIYNTTNDTLCFLSSTCEGMKELLKYDTNKFVLEPGRLCYISRPIVQKIKPKDRYNFEAYFIFNNSSNSKIKLNLYFYPVNKAFNCSKISLADFGNIVYKEKNLIGAVEKEIIPASK